MICQICTRLFICLCFSYFQNRKINAFSFFFKSFDFKFRWRKFGQYRRAEMNGFLFLLLISFQFHRSLQYDYFFSVCLFIFCFPFFNGCIAVLLPPIEVSGGSIAGSIVGVLFAAIVVAVVIVLIMRSDFSFQNKHHHVSANERKHSKSLFLMFDRVSIRIYESHD